MSAVQFNKKGKVSRVLPFSCVDGPGNRLVIFLQGCNFNCLNCHNPHTINHCNHCGDCVTTCPSGALIKKNNNVVWLEEVCTHCDRCLETCSYHSNPKIKEWTVLDMIDLIRKHHLFIDGVTVSGGEATLQLGFIVELFKAIKQDVELAHLSCFIDSNGSLTTHGWVKIAPYLDGAMIDLKAWQSETHRWLVGRDNHRVILSIKYLVELGKLHEVRLLHIPEKSDLACEVDALAQFLNTLPDRVTIRLNGFVHHGVIGEALNWPACDRESMNGFYQALKRRIPHRIALPKTPLYRDIA